VLLHENKIYLAYTQVRELRELTRDGVRRALISGNLALAVSTDGVKFEPASGTLPLIRQPAGYFAAGGSGPSLFVEGGRLRLYFGGLSSLETPGFSIGLVTLSR
jgi:hypothetical protein